MFFGQKGKHCPVNVSATHWITSNSVYTFRGTRSPASTMPAQVEAPGLPKKKKVSSLLAHKAKSELLNSANSFR